MAGKLSQVKLKSCMKNICSSIWKIDWWHLKNIFLAVFSFLWMILAGFQLHIRYLSYRGSIDKFYGTNLRKMLTIVAIIATLMCLTSIIGKYLLKTMNCFKHTHTTSFLWKNIGGWDFVHPVPLCYVVEWY